MPMPKQPKWHSNDGELIACTEKIKVMTQNMEELFQMTQDAFEDALLMGCSEKQIRDYLMDLVQGVDNPYQ